MKVAIIGTGNMASGLANAFAGAQHEVTIGSRDPAKSAKLAEKIGQGAQGGGIEAAVKLADVVVLAIPYGGRLMVPSTSMCSTCSASSITSMCSTRATRAYRSALPIC